MERTGLGRGVQKPPVAPKPKFVPPPRHVQLSAAAKPALNLEVSQSKPALTPEVSQSKPALTPEVSQSKPALTPEVSQSKPALTPEVSQSKPALTSEVSQSKPALTPEVSQSKPALTPEVSQSKPALTPEVSQSKPALTPEVSQSKPALTPEVSQSKPALTLEVSQSQKPVIKPALAPKPELSVRSLEPKPICTGECQVHCKSRKLWQVDLVNNRNAHLADHKKPERHYITPICVRSEGKYHDWSPKDNSKRFIQHGKCAKPNVSNKSEHSRNPVVQNRNNQHTTQGTKGQALKHQNYASVQPEQENSPEAVKRYENVPIANRSVENETIKLQNQANDTLSSVVTGMPPKSLKAVAMKKNMPSFCQKGDTGTLIKLPASENTTPGGVIETSRENVRLPTPGGYPRWRMVLSEQTQTQDVHLAGPSQNTSRKECLNVQDVFKKECSVDEGKPSMTLYKYQHPTPMNLTKQMKLNGIAAKQVHYQSKDMLGVKPSEDIVSNIPKLESNDSATKNPIHKKPVTKVMPKVRSFSTSDISHPNWQNKATSQKVMALDLAMKKCPRLDSNTIKDKQWADVDWRTCRNQNGPRTQVSLYRSHEFKVQGRELLYGHVTSVSPASTEQSVDGETLLMGIGNALGDGHIYENIPDYVNVSPRSREYLQTQQPTSMQQDHLSNTKDMYDKFALGEFINSKVHHNCTERNVNEDVVNSDDTHSEDETDNSSEEENGSDAGKGEDENDIKKSRLFHIAKEIMTSEKAFVNVLKLLNISFRDAVAKASFHVGKSVIEERVLNQVLSSLPQLYELNCDLLHELEDRIACWNENSGVADIFLKKGPYLKMYTSYICEFDRNVALLEEQCKKNPAFAKVVREFESSPCCANLAVKHYMLKPIQRLPQYELLLSDYLKNLKENSPDYKDTQAALNVVKEVVNHANESMKQGDNFQKVMQVQCRLTGQHQIVQPGRVLLKEGSLMKLSRKDMQPRMFFLFNDTLLYTTPVQSGQYKLNNMLSLAGMKVSKPSQEGYQNELNIESVERSFILSASSPACRDEWLNTISAAIDDYTKKQISFNSSRSPEEGDREATDSILQLGSKAPIWIPDLRTSMCMICTCEFTLTWRRHHCRACGKVVCQACSSNKYPLEYLKNHPARVCDHCLEVLQQNSSGNQTPGATLSPNTKHTSAFPFRKQKRIPAALKEVSANTDKPSMSGYMERMKANKKPWKRLWFVIKDKVLYTYAASEDVAALESLPLLGFSLKEDESGSLQHFWLYHKDVLFYTFKTDDSSIYHRWMEAFREAMVL